MERTTGCAQSKLIAFSMRSPVKHSKANRQFSWISVSLVFRPLFRPSFVVIRLIRGLLNIWLRPKAALGYCLAIRGRLLCVPAPEIVFEPFE